MVEFLRRRVLQERQNVHSMRGIQPAVPQQHLEDHQALVLIKEPEGRGGQF